MLPPVFWGKPPPAFRLFDRPYFLLTLAILFWSGNLILARAMRTEIPPIGLTFWRWFIGLLLLLKFALPSLKTDLPQILHHWKLLLLFSGLGIVGFPVLFYTGLQSTTAMNGALIQATMPLAIVLASYLLFRDTISWRQVLGILLSLAGAIAIVSQGSWQILQTLSFNPGDIWILGAIACYAAYSSLLRLRPLLHPLSFLAILFGFATLLLLPFYIWESLTRQTVQFNLLTLCSVGYIAIFPSIFSQLFFNRGVELIGANRAGLLANLLPVFGSLMAIVFLKETFHHFHAIGMGLILLGIFLATYLNPAKRQPQHKI